MKYILFFTVVLFFIMCLFSVFLQTLVLHPLKTLYYTAVDVYRYFYEHRYDAMKTGKLICYTALFGGGKTLSCVHYVKSLYYRYNDRLVFDVDRQKFVTQKVHIISNVDLDIPYEKFESLSQIVRVADRFKDMDIINDTLTCTVVLGDEFSVQMNSRSFKTNIDPLFLNTLLTCRHHHIMMIYNAQRFNHVDALLRQVTTYVVNCRKVWRVVIQSTYDAYVLENTTDTLSVKPLGQRGWFVTDSDFNSYDTLACVGNLIKKVDENDFDSEIEIIQRKGVNKDDYGSTRRWRSIFHPRRK